MQHQNPVRFTDPGRRRSILTLADDTNPFLPLIHNTRQQLLDHQAYRKPFHKCILSLYRAGSSAHRWERRKIRPTDPTDTDIHTFILSHWPEVQHRERRDFMPRFEFDVESVRPPARQSDPCKSGAGNSINEESESSRHSACSL